MKMRTRIFLLLCLMALSVWAALGAARSLRPLRESELPGELYQALIDGAEHAEYLLREQNGYLAVFPNRRGAEPERVTAIALSTLRAADRAMLKRGIPAADRQSLLQLLEDLGS